jgi:hypothetical protein
MCLCALPHPRGCLLPCKQFSVSYLLVCLLRDFVLPYKFQGKSASMKENSCSMWLTVPTGEITCLLLPWTGRRRQTTDAEACLEYSRRSRSAALGQAGSALPRSSKLRATHHQEGDFLIWLGNSLLCSPAAATINQKKGLHMGLGATDRRFISWFLL